MSNTYIHPAKRERIKNIKKLQKSRPLGNFHNLKENLQGKRFGSVSHNYVPVGPSFPRSSVTREDKRRLDALGVIGGKKKKKSRKKKKKSRKKKRKKKKKSRKRKKKAGFLLEGSLGYYLYQTKMKGKKAIFGEWPWPVQYKDQEPEPEAKVAPAEAKVAPADPTPPPAKGGKKSRKKRKSRQSFRDESGISDSG